MTTATTIPTGGDTAERRRWLMLAVLITGQFMALLDVTIVNVAIPTIQAKLHASGAALQLIVAGYTVTYAMLLITGARLGDLRGHRRLFLAGLGTFTLASLACGLAPTTGALVTARFVQGVGAALMVPQILSVIQRQFAGAARARALGVYAATLASGAVVGQALGGLLVSANLLGASWRPVFLVNVPVGVAAAVLVPRLVPADQVPGGRRLDLPGLLTASGAVLLVVLPLVLGHEQGWPAWTFVSLAAGCCWPACSSRSSGRWPRGAATPCWTSGCCARRGWWRGWPRSPRRWSATAGSCSPWRCTCSSGSATARCAPG
jgi:MFS family permease